MIVTAEDIAGALQSLSGATPFLGIAATFGIYLAASKLHHAIGEPVFLHPLLIAIAGVAAFLHVTSIPYEHYFRAAEPLHLLLGPVVVLLAVPLWRQLDTIRSLGPGLLVILLVGALTGLATSAGIAILLAAPGELVSTLAPKSVTTPVAIKISESLGGIPAITALVVILTGLVGATFGWPLLSAIGIRDGRAKGFAVGVASHVIGTARIFQINERAGAFASLGMILNALMTTLLIGLARLWTSW